MTSRTCVFSNVFRTVARQDSNGRILFHLNWAVLGRNEKWDKVSGHRSCPLSLPLFLYPIGIVMKQRILMTTCFISWLTGGQCVSRNASSRVVKFDFYREKKKKHSVQSLCFISFALFQSFFYTLYCSSRLSKLFICMLCSIIKCHIILFVCVGHIADDGVVHANSPGRSGRKRKWNRPRGRTHVECKYIFNPIHLSYSRIFCARYSRIW